MASAHNISSLDRRRHFVIGFPRSKAANLKGPLSLPGAALHFVKDGAAAAARRPTEEDVLIVWGRDTAPDVEALSQRTGAALWHVEDGFVRSVGLGSDMIPPLSIVVDRKGLHFDPTRPSDIEDILAGAVFTQEELDEAAFVRDFIVGNGITKYNLEARSKATWKPAGREVILVPGQVEDDASIRYGCRAVNTNLKLLQAARQAHPHAFIVYKPHPDVVAGNRQGAVDGADLRRICDHVELNLSVTDCIDASDAVHTMTSLSGLDALLRGKQVTVYGQPFYAGWGLTTDVDIDAEVVNRRTRKISPEELIAGAYLRYPLYWDPRRKIHTDCRTVLQLILAQRNALEARGNLWKLRKGKMRRLLRQFGYVMKAYVKPR